MICCASFVMCYIILFECDFPLLINVLLPTLMMIFPPLQRTWRNMWLYDGAVSKQQQLPTHTEKGEPSSKCSAFFTSFLTMYSGSLVKDYRRGMETAVLKQRRLKSRGSFTWLMGNRQLSISSFVGYLSASVQAKCVQEQRMESKDSFSLL